MDEVRLLLREEGREARNLLAFHVSVDEGNHVTSADKLYGKPPCGPRSSESTKILKRSPMPQQSRVGGHLRSASTGRDKKSELRARYWALLFGNLQRAVGEIYNTVEMHESLSECQEVVLVMENYTRDFRSLAEWFQLKWDYENTPPLQRPTSLAWEVRKTTLPSPSHSERVSPVQLLKQGQMSPQSKGSKECVSDLLSVSPQPLPILEHDELLNAEIKAIDSNKINLSETEHILSPSEDQRTYIDVIKKSDVQRAEVGTDTEGLEISKNVIVKKSVIKINQECQTDDDPTEKDLSTIKTLKTDVKVTRTPNVIAVKPAYSTAVTRLNKSPLKTMSSTLRQNGNISKVTSAVTKPASPLKFNTYLRKGPDPVKFQQRVISNPLLRSKTSGDIKPSSFTAKSNTFIRPKPVIVAKTNTSNRLVQQKGNTKVFLEKKSTSSSNLNKPNALNRKVVNSGIEILKCNNLDSDKESLCSSVETVVNTSETQSKRKDDTSASNDVDGWCTVKGRSRFKSNGKINDRKLISHWANRFNEVSATTSLPALALLEENENEMPIKRITKSEEKSTKKDLQSKRLQTVLGKSVKSTDNKKDEKNVWTMKKGSSGNLNKIVDSKKENKIFLLRNKSLEQKAHSSEEKLNDANSTKLDNKTQNLFENKRGSLDSKMIDFKYSNLSKVNKEFIKKECALIRNDLDKKINLLTEKYLSYNLTNEMKSNKMKNDTEMDLSELSISTKSSNIEDQELENFDEGDGSYSDRGESLDEEENNRKTQQLNEEEALLTQEIAELESSTNDMDTETDGTETDGEAGDDEAEGESINKYDDLSLEARYEPVLAGMSLGERMDTLAALEDLVARHPGRAIQLHQKLSNPARSHSITETLRRYQAKQSRAQQRRQVLRQERAVRLQALLARVKDVKAAKNQLIEEKRQRMENRLLRAEQNRTQHLRSVVRKAHDEEEKLREIAFIKELEAQNKRHDFLELCKEQKGRLKDLREGQRKKIEEQAARGAAVEERRRALAQERQSRLEQLEAERRLRAERVGKRQLEKQEQAREKARGREERLSALHAQQLASTIELQKRISQKQEESARRHEENIEQIRQKALELSILRSHNEEPHTPALIPYEARKLCTVCNVQISSEVYLLSHLRGRAHQEAVCQATGSLVGDQLGKYELAHIVDVPNDQENPRDVAAKERAKMLRKKCKKLKQRLAVKGAQFESDYKVPTVDTVNKKILLKNAQKVTSLMEHGWCPNECSQLDRALGDISRLLTKGQLQDFIAFQAAGWFSVLSKLLAMALNVNSSPPVKSLVLACNLWLLACKKIPHGEDNCRYSILSNRIIVALDILNDRLQGLATDEKLPAEPLATAAMHLLAGVLEHAPDDVPMQRLHDVVSYSVCVGVVEQLAQCCVSVRGPVHDDAQACGFLQAALGLLTGLATRCGPPPPDVNGGKPNLAQPSDPTHLTAALHATELVGVVSMLYGTLLPTGASPRCEGKPPGALPKPCLALATAVCRLLRRVAELDLKRFQEALGAEGVSLQFRHIASHLLWVCATPPSEVDNATATATRDLLHEVIVVVGYFAVGHADNQMLVASGYAPSVLQQLCTLPFPYFSVPDLSAILFPTLLACRSSATAHIVDQELSYQLLDEFRNSNVGNTNALVKLLPEV